MQTLVDIPESELEALDRLALQAKVSRASLIRAAISKLLAEDAGPRHAEAFGLWGEREVDGLAYQNEIRREW